MFRRRRSDTHELTDGTIVLTARRSHVRPLMVGLALVLALVFGVGGVRYFLDRFTTGPRLVAMEAENVELRTALDKARFELEVELATRSELERQLASLNERLRLAEEELAFVKAAGGRGSGR